MDVHVGGGVLGVTALEQVGNAARELDDFLAPGDFPEGIIQDFSVLGGDDGGEFALAGLSSSRKAKRTWVRRAIEVSLPCGERGLGRGNGGVALSWLASATWPVTFPVAGLVTGAVRSPAGT